MHSATLASRACTRSRVWALQWNVSRSHKQRYWKDKVQLLTVHEILISTGSDVQHAGKHDASHACIHMFYKGTSSHTHVLQGYIILTQPSTSEWLSAEHVSICVHVAQVLLAAFQQHSGHALASQRLAVQQLGVVVLGEGRLGLSSRLRLSCVPVSQRCCTQSWSAESRQLSCTVTACRHADPALLRCELSGSA